MNLQKYEGANLSDMKVYNELQEELVADLKDQLDDQGIEVLNVLPNMYCFGMVVAQGSDPRRFLHITIPNVNDDAEWAQHVRLRRMSSERDWKGDAFHYCAWAEAGAQAAHYLTAEFDDEIL